MVRMPQECLWCPEITCLSSGHPGTKVFFLMQGSLWRSQNRIAWSCLHTEVGKWAKTPQVALSSKSIRRIWSTQWIQTDLYFPPVVSCEGLVNDSFKHLPIESPPPLGKPSKLRDKVFVEYNFTEPVPRRSCKDIKFLHNALVWDFKGFLLELLTTKGNVIILYQEYHNKFKCSSLPQLHKWSEHAPTSSSSPWHLWLWKIWVLRHIGGWERWGLLIAAHSCVPWALVMRVRSLIMCGTASKARCQVQLAAVLGAEWTPRKSIWQ